MAGMPAGSCRAWFPIAVVDSVLLDTGPLVAMVNRRDVDHLGCVENSRNLRSRLISIEGVLVEACHLLARVHGGPDKALQLVLGMEVELIAPTAPRVQRARKLMARYREVPMDLVDGLLVAAAEER